MLSHSSSQIDENGPVVKPSDLDAIIEIQWRKTSRRWEVDFSPQGKVFTTAPTVYKVKGLLHI